MTMFSHPVFRPWPSTARWERRARKRRQKCWRRRPEALRTNCHHRNNRGLHKWTQSGDITQKKQFVSVIGARRHRCVSRVNLLAGQKDKLSRLLGCFALQSSENHTSHQVLNLRWLFVYAQLLWVKFTPAVSTTHTSPFGRLTTWRVDAV